MIRIGSHPMLRLVIRDQAGERIDLTGRSVKLIFKQGSSAAGSPVDTTLANQLTHPGECTYRLVGETGTVGVVQVDAIIDQGEDDEVGIDGVQSFSVRAALS